MANPNNPSQGQGQSSSGQSSSGQNNVSFRCSDVGPKTCNWQVSGRDESEIMPKIEQHGREQHNMSIDDNVRQQVRGAIRRAA